MRAYAGVLARILLRDFAIQLESGLGWAQLEQRLLETQTLESSNHTQSDNLGAFVQLIGHQVEVLGY